MACFQRALPSDFHPQTILVENQNERLCRVEVEGDLLLEHSIKSPNGVAAEDHRTNGEDFEPEEGVEILGTSHSMSNLRSEVAVHLRPSQETLRKQIMLPGVEETTVCESPINRT